MQTSIDSPATIAAANNLGFTAGTWDVQVINFCPGDTVTLTVDVIYPERTRIIHEDDDGNGTGDDGDDDDEIDVDDELDDDVTIIFQRFDGTIEGKVALQRTPGTRGLSARVANPSGSLVSIVQIVVLDASGLVKEIRGAYVTTQADLLARAQNIQSQLLTTTDPVVQGNLQAKLSAVQAAIPTAPTTESLPPLP
jgi:hypothetical protein